MFAKELASLTQFVLENSSENRTRRCLICILNVTESV